MTSLTHPNLMALVAELRSWPSPTQGDALSASVVADMMERAAQAISTLTAEVEELRAEVARLRNIMNEDGLHDPELAEMAGKPIGVIEASVKATKGEGDKPSNTQEIEP